MNGVNASGLIKITLFISLYLLTVGVSALESSIAGRVTGVLDGDTIEMLSEQGRERIRVRFNGIDAPEKNQDFGQASKRYLSSLLYQKTVTVNVRGKDRYGRYLGDVYLGQRWVNLYMVESGMAWFYEAYSRDPDLKAAQAYARSRKIGLWSLPRAVPPWEFRRN